MNSVLKIILKRVHLSCMLVISVSINVDAQTYETYFMQGVNAYEQHRFHQADSLFSRAIEIYPSRDALYNRGLTRKILLDTCGHCADMRTVTEAFEDGIAHADYMHDCLLKSDTTFLTTAFEQTEKQQSRYYDITSKSNCGAYAVGVILEMKMSDISRFIPEHEKSIKSQLQENVYDNYAAYYLEDSVKIYTSCRECDFNEPNFRGGHQSLVYNQLRQLLMQNQPSLSSFKDETLSLGIVVSPAGKIHSIFCPLLPIMSKEQFAKVSKTMMPLLLAHFSFKKTRVMDAYVYASFQLRLKPIK